MEKNSINPENNVTVTNILIYKDTPEASEYSLFKLLDWRIGHAVKLTVRRNFVDIDDCPETLQKRLLQEVGGAAAGKSWDAELTVSLGDEPILPRVIAIVKKWVDEQD